MFLKSKNDLTEKSAWNNSKIIFEDEDFWRLQIQRTNFESSSTRVFLFECSVMQTFNLKSPFLASAGKMSFKFNKKALVTGVSAVEADKLLVYAQNVKKISSENGCILDGIIFCVDVGAAALKKQSKKERWWLEEEVENAKITPGTIITVNGKERYVKTEVCKKWSVIEGCSSLYRKNMNYLFLPLDIFSAVRGAVA